MLFVKKLTRQLSECKASPVLTCCPSVSLSYAMSSLLHSLLRHHPSLPAG